MRIVSATVSKFVRSHLPVEVDEMINIGRTAAFQAIERWDPAKGTLSTFLPRRVYGEIMDHVREMDWIPRLVRSKAAKLNGAMKALEAKHGRTPTEAELAAELKISVPELVQLIADANAVGVISLDKKWYETDSFKDVREVDVLEDKRSERPTTPTRRLDFLREATKGLSKRERLIIIGYFYEEMTMKEIGRQLELSESRVSQMLTSMLPRMRRQLELSREGGTIDVEFNFN